MSITRWAIVIVIAGSGAIALACTGGGGSSSTGTSSSGGSSSGSSGTSDDETCSLVTKLSGGVDLDFGGNQACIYSQLAMGFAPLDGKATINLTIRDEVERNQTGTFRAQMDVRANDESWTGAECSVDIESNTLEQAASDSGGVSFDRYLLKGKGTCSTPATHRSDAGTPKEPVTIGAFTFVSSTLFY